MSDTYSWTAHIVVMANGRSKQDAATEVLEYMMDADIACSLHEVDKLQDRIAELEGAQKDTFLAGWDYHSQSRNRMDMPRDRIGAYNHWRQALGERDD